MNMKKYFFRVLVTSLFVVMAVVSISIAEEAKYPQRPVTAVVQFPIAGGGDIYVRGIANVIEKYFGQPWTVINKPGGAGVVAGDFLSKAKPDGYTIGNLISTGADPELYTYFRKPTYKFSDLAPIIRVISYSYCLIVHKDAPWRSLKEFIEYVKVHPKEIRWAHQGVGHPYHLLGVALNRQNGLDMIDVPFKGSADENLAVLGKKVEAAIVSVVTAKQFVEAGQLLMLAVQSPSRLPYLPNVPTFEELGQVRGFPIHYDALFAPKGTPDQIIKTIHDATKKAIEDGAFKSAMDKSGMDILYGSPEDVKRDVEMHRKVYGEIFTNLGFVSK
jgi:tripartite-type tricarboxylate transporter receptor subunit TctC